MTVWEDAMRGSNLLLELRIQTQRVWGTRLYTDGRVDEYSDQRITFVDGQFHYRDQPPEWRALTRYSPEEVARLEDLIRSTGALDLPARLEPAQPVLDGTIMIWDFWLDGRHHRVETHGTEANRHPALETLRRALERTTAEALRRAGAGGGGV